MGAPTAEDEAGAALDVATVEVEVVGSMMTKGNVEVLTIKSSSEWMGTLIEEETEMAETREDAGIRNIPSTSVSKLESPLPQRKRRRSKEEVQASRPVRTRRTRSVVATEAMREKWANIEANIELPILRPKENVSPQELVAEEPQIGVLLFENGMLKEEVQAH